MNNLSDGYIIIPIMFNVVKRPTCCSQNTEHREGVYLSRGGVEISLGCIECLSTEEFTKRLFEHSGFILPKST